MSARSGIAVAHPNIALIKYWGNADSTLRIPSNGSISMTLGDLSTRMTVSFERSLPTDRLTINGERASESALMRVSGHLDIIRKMSGLEISARVISESNFPRSAGIASSASAFAALSLAGAKAANLELNEVELSRLARRGSGSASRSIFGGFVELHTGTSDKDAFSEQVAPAKTWDLVDCIAIVSRDPKAIGSTAGHALAGTSPIQAARIKDTPRRLELCRQAIIGRRFSHLAAIVEQDNNLMHAVMLTSTPPLIYWLPATVQIMHSVVAWRNAGLRVCYTIDAGPNVHVICPQENTKQISQVLEGIPGVIQILQANVGGPARIVSEK